MQPSKHILLVLLVLALAEARGDTGPTGAASGTGTGSAGDESSDRRKKYDDNNDQSAAYNGDQKSKQQLTPPMLQHLQQAQDHRQKAEQARQQGDQGTAGKEDALANMEQMKGEQLKQQMDENQKSADKNRESAKLLRNPDDDNGAKGINKAMQSITVDKERAAAKDAASAAKAAAGTSMEPAPASPAPPNELAKFDDFKPTRPLPESVVAKAPPEPPAPQKADPPQAKGWEADLDQVGKSARIGIGFADNAGTAPGVSPGRAALGGEAPQSRLLSAATDAPAQGNTLAPDGFPKPDGGAAATTAEKAGSAQDDVPKILAERKTKKDGKDADDFWKSIDPKKKKLRIAGSTRGRRVKEKGVVSVRASTAAAAE